MGMSRARVLWKLLLILVVALLILGLVATLGAGLVARQFRESAQIAPNVFVEEVPVGGMEPPQAEAAVSAAWAARLPRAVSLRYPGGAFAASPASLGVHLGLKAALARAQQVGRESNLLALLVTRFNLRRQGVHLKITNTVDPNVAAAFLASLRPVVDRPARNADVRIVKNRVEPVPEVLGLRLDVSGSQAKLVRALADPALTAADLVVRTQEPSVHTRDLEHLDTLLGTYTTHYRTYQKDRSYNLRLAVGKVTRSLLLPRDTLSLNDRIGPRLQERGFRSAPIFVNGEVEPSTGGGVCQVATTVYNAVLLAGLEVVDRHHHSRPVDYAPSGQDATVYWGQCDLKVRNNLRHPILILGKVGDGDLTVTVIGSHEDKTEVEIVRSGVSTISYDTKETQDPDLEPGKTVVDKPGRNGVQVTVTRVVKRAGKVVSKERLHTDTYSPATEVVRVGPPAPPEPVTPPSAAPKTKGAPAATPAGAKKAAGLPDASGAN